MGQIDHMGRGQRGIKALFARGMNTSVVAQIGRTPRFIKGRERINAIPQSTDDNGRIFGKSISGITVGPAAVSHERQR